MSGVVKEQHVFPTLPRKSIFILNAGITTFLAFARQLIFDVTVAARVVL